jgi:hypothetical protein
VRPRNCSPRLRSSQPWKDEKDSDASARRDILRDLDPARGGEAAAGPGAGAARGPPPAARGAGRGHQARATGRPPSSSRDQRRPHRHAADEVLRPVDRVHDPLAARRGRCASNSSPTTASRGRVRRSCVRTQLLGRAVGVA